MDITMHHPDACFTLRTAAIILRDDCLLAVRHAPTGSIYTIGGRVHMGESTADAAVREALEETGQALDIDRLLFVHEGFFTHAGKNHHEVCFFYLMQSPAIPIPDNTPTDQPGEALVWLPVNRLPDTPLVPAFLRTALQDLPLQIKHIVSK